MKIYTELAEWWQLFSPAEEYADEAASFSRMLREHCAPPCRTLVEFGSGAGSNALHLKQHFTLTLVDLSSKMLAVSRRLNPECEHIVGDMRDIRLGRRFDAVFIHDAIMYMTTKDDLRRAIETAYAHCAPGGVAVIAPDYVRERFAPSTEHGGHDGADRSMRWLGWHFDPDPTDTVYEAHYGLLLREGDEVRVEHDRHEEGLFARADWLRLLEETGFEPEIIVDLYEREVFVARIPESAP